MKLSLSYFLYLYLCVVDLKYFKLLNSVRSNDLSLKYQKVHQVAKILKFENLSLMQRLNSFEFL